MFCSIGGKVAWTEAAEIGEMKNIHGVVISFESWFGFLTFNSFCLRTAFGRETEHVADLSLHSSCKPMPDI